MPKNAATRKEIRYDHGELVLRKTEGGFRRYDVKIARAGVFPYVYQDGSIRMEAKLPDDLFSKTTLDSAKGAPITEDHVPPSDSRGLVTPENYQKYTKGALGDSITVQDGHICGAETLFDKGLIAKVDAGEKVEVSIGFELDIDPTPGEYEGQRYDCAQRNIRINHVAHVDKGRAGDTVRVQLDSVPSDVHIAIMSATAGNSPQGEIMPKTATQADAANTRLSVLERVAKLLGFDSADATATPAAGTETAAEGAAKPTVEDLQKQITDLTAKLKTATATIAELKKAEAGEPDLNQSEEAAMDSKLAKRSALLDAAKIIIPDVKTDGLKDRDIKLQIIAKKLPFEQNVRQDASLTDVRIDARFEAALELARKEAADAGIGINADTIRTDEAEITAGKKARASRWDESEKARAKK